LYYIPPYVGVASTKFFKIFQSKVFNHKQIKRKKDDQMEKVYEIGGHKFFLDQAKAEEAFAAKKI
jgi:hypothetical protein